MILHGQIDLRTAMQYPLCQSLFFPETRGWELSCVVRISIEDAIEYPASLTARKVPSRTCRQFQSSTIRTKDFSRAGSATIMQLYWSRSLWGPSKRKILK